MSKKPTRPMSVIMSFVVLPLAIMFGSDAVFHTHLLEGGWYSYLGLIMLIIALYIFLADIILSFTTIFNNRLAGVLVSVNIANKANDRAIMNALHVGQTEVLKEINDEDVT